MWKLIGTLVMVLAVVACSDKKDSLSAKAGDVSDVAALPADATVLTDVPTDVTLVTDTILFPTAEVVEK